MLVETTADAPDDLAGQVAPRVLARTGILAGTSNCWPRGRCPAHPAENCDDARRVRSGGVVH